MKTYFKKVEDLIENNEVCPLPQKNKMMVWLVIIIGVLGVILAVLLFIENEDHYAKRVLLGFTLIAIFVLTVFAAIGTQHYKKGQVDALTGKIRYELITLPDSTRIWQEIGEIK